ncbi:38440_t:CDS:2 [Gigaspora margarita]|uniref:38440_t:CDS:1 n=1 Tax=Gigaspora margarita TaxID=4874 RepID=A0ABN7WG47_GIGMA|nr:38440_t:CDS:2 [Gigaspora margarita]
MANKDSNNMRLCITKLVEEFNSVDNQKDVNWLYKEPGSLIIELRQPRVAHYQGETSGEQRGIQNTNSDETTPLIHIKQNYSSDIIYFFQK